MGSGLPGQRLAFHYLLSRRREYEQQNRRTRNQNIEVKNIFLFLSKTSAVRNSLFDIQNIKQAESPSELA